MSIKSDLKNYERELKAISREIVAEEKNLKAIKEEIEEAEGEVEIAESRVAYFDLLIKDLVAEFGAEGEEIFREMFPEEADQILKS